MVRPHVPACALQSCATVATSRPWRAWKRTQSWKCCAGMPAQHFHDCVLFHALQGLDVATVAHDCKAQAGTCGLTIDGDRARAACPVLASEMRGGQAAALAQEIGQGFTRLHLVT